MTLGWAKLAIFAQHRSHAWCEFAQVEREHRAAATSIASRCICSRRSTSSGSAARVATSRSATTPTWCASIGKVRGAKEGATVRRWIFQSSPTARNSRDPRLGKGDVPSPRCGRSSQHCRLARGGLPRAIQGQLDATKKAPRQHFILERASGEGCQHVVPHLQGELTWRQQVAAGKGRRKINSVRAGCRHSARLAVCFSLRSRATSRHQPELVSGARPGRVRHA